MVQNNSEIREISPKQACTECFMIFCRFVNLETALRNSDSFDSVFLDILLRIEHKILLFVFRCLTLF